jgi:hypothetical protein
LFYLFIGEFELEFFEGGDLGFGGFVCAGDGTGLFWLGDLLYWADHFGLLYLDLAALLALFGVDRFCAFLHRYL